MIWIWVAAGGALGALLRMATAQVIGRVAGGAEMPMGIVLVNIVGCGLMGALFVLLERFELATYLRQGLTVGLLGAFTTFSTFALEAYQLVIDGRLAVAAIYVILSLLGSFIALLAGIFLTQWSLSH